MIAPVSGEWRALYAQDGGAACESRRIAMWCERECDGGHAMVYGITNDDAGRLVPAFNLDGFCGYALADEDDIMDVMRNALLAMAGEENEG